MASTPAQIYPAPIPQRPRISASALASLRQHIKEAETATAAIRHLRAGDNADPQSQSTLLGRLPFEIRNLIWKEVAKNHEFIRIAWYGGRLVRVRPEPVKGARHEQEFLEGLLAVELKWLVFPVFDLYHFDDKCWIYYYMGVQSDIMSLLLTCQKIYSEFAHVLFSSVTFNFIGYVAALKFMEFTPVQIFEKVSSVEIAWVSLPEAYGYSSERYRFEGGAPTARIDYQAMIEDKADVIDAFSKCTNMQKFVIKKRGEM